MGSVKTVTEAVYILNGGVEVSSKGFETVTEVVYILVSGIEISG